MFLLCCYFMAFVISCYNIFYFYICPFFLASKFNDSDLKYFSYLTGRLISIKYVCTPLMFRNGSFGFNATASLSEVLYSGPQKYLFQWITMFISSYHVFVPPTMGLKLRPYSYKRLWLWHKCSMGIVEPKFMNATYWNISFLLLQLMHW